MESNRHQDLWDHLPVITFIVVYFLLHLLFDWMEATQFIIAVSVSMLTYLMMLADFKQEYKNPDQHRRLNFYAGLLSLLFIIVFLTGFLHWNRILSLTVRMAILMSMLVLYFVILFRAIRVLSTFRRMQQNKQK